MDRRVSRQEGLSLIEVLITLLVMSLVLGIILPIASRSVLSNLSLGERALSTGNADVAEILFRRLLTSAIAPAPAYAKRPTTVTGDAERARLSVAAGGARPCGSDVSADVELLIRRDGAGGRLLCVAGDQEVEWLRWSGGAATFSYSPDGQEWSSRWEPRDARASSDEVEAVLRPDADRPFLRFSLSPNLNASGAPQAPHFWTERVGILLESPVELQLIEREGASATVRLPEP